MKQKGFAPVILLIGILVIISIGGGYFLWMKSLEPLPVAPTSFISQPSPAFDTTASWQTYTNIKYGYSFKYPRNWYIKDMTNIIRGSNVINAEYLNDAQIIDMNNYKVDITLDSDNIQNLQQFLNYGDAGGQNTAETTNTKIAGKDGIVATVTTSEINHTTGQYIVTGKYYKVLIPFKNQTLKITSHLDQKQLVDQITSTLKFTN